MGPRSQKLTWQQQGFKAPPIGTRHGSGSAIHMTGLVVIENLWLPNVDDWQGQVQGSQLLLLATKPPLVATRKGALQPCIPHSGRHDTEGCLTGIQHMLQFCYGNIYRGHSKRSQTNKWLESPATRFRKK